MQVCIGLQEALSQQICISHWVKQGCILAPFLFNFFINSLIPQMVSPSFFSPAIGCRKISMLLYVDDLVLLSLNKIGLKRMLSQFGQLPKEERLPINYAKTKIMVYGRRAPNNNWSLDGHVIEQVHFFKYLGIYFCEKLSWKHHLNATVLLSSRSVWQLKIFF